MSGCMDLTGGVRLYRFQNQLHSESEKSLYDIPLGATDTKFQSPKVSVLNGQVVKAVG